MRELRSRKHLERSLQHDGSLRRLLDHPDVLGRDSRLALQYHGKQSVHRLCRRIHLLDDLQCCYLHHLRYLLRRNDLPVLCVHGNGEPRLRRLLYLHRRIDLPDFCVHDGEPRLHPLRRALLCRILALLTMHNHGEPSLQ